MKIVWGTLLKKARLDAKKYKKIEEKMMGLGSEMVVVVHQLHAARVTPQEREYNMVKRIREVAYWLKEEGALRLRIIGGDIGIIHKIYELSIFRI